MHILIRKMLLNFILLLLVKNIISTSILSERTSVNATIKNNLSFYRYQVTIHLSYNDELLCNGAIISKHFVLTEAQCLFYNWGGQMPSFILSIRVKGYQYAQFFNTSKVHLHPEYNKATMENNLGIIHIDGYFPYKDQILTPIKYDVNTATSPSCFFSKCTEDSCFSPITIITCDYFIQSMLKMLCAKPQNYIEMMCPQEFKMGNVLICDGKLTGILTIPELSCIQPNTTLLYSNLFYHRKWLNIYSKSVIQLANVYFITIFICIICTII